MGIPKLKKGKRKKEELAREDSAIINARGKRVLAKTSSIGRVHLKEKEGKKANAGKG